MSRPVRPIRPALESRPAYPRLPGAWRALLGAAPLMASSLAFGDVTLPAQGQGGAAVNGSLVAAVSHEAQPKDPPQTPTPQPKPPPQRPLAGKIACPRPPVVPAADPKKAIKKVEPKLRGDIARAAPPTRFLIGAAEGFVIHPHGPDEPCFIDEGKDEA